MENKLDIYEKAMNYLEAHPDQVLDIWDDPKSHPSGILFQAASPTGDPQKNESTLLSCGDICEIISGECVAYTDEITSLILKDDRIPPIGIEDIPQIEPVRASLEVFSEWQNLFDLTWNRDPVQKLEEWGYSEKELDREGT